MITNLSNVLTPNRPTLTPRPATRSEGPGTRAAGGVGDGGFGEGLAVRAGWLGQGR